MPIQKRSPIRHRSPASENRPHPLHKHRPVVTMVIGFTIILAIFAAALGSSRVRNVVLPTHEDKKEKVTVDTSKWLTYKDTATGLSFRHPEDLEIGNQQAGKDRLISLSSKADSASRISIFISPTSYLGFEGLPQTKTTLAGSPAVKISDALIGVKKGSTYFTFDAGLDSSNTPIFQELVKTIKFE